jgi:hypothetical protein
MLDYDEINKRMDEKMKKNSEEEKKSEKYIGSLLFLLHLCLLSGMIWIGIMAPVPPVWFTIMGYGLIFMISITVHKNGSSGKAILITLGSIFLGIFLLIATCFGILSQIH